VGPGEDGHGAPEGIDCHAPREPQISDRHREREAHGPGGPPPI
jgi:hypothetical protein